MPGVNLQREKCKVQPNHRIIGGLLMAEGRIGGTKIIARPDGPERAYAGPERGAKH